MLCAWSDFQFSLGCYRNYSATVSVASAATLSVAVVSATSTASTAAASTAAIESAIRIESAVAFAASAALLPQDAKDTAAIATAIKTNFFIFFAFKKRNTINCFIKTAQRYVLFQYVVLEKPTFFILFWVTPFFFVLSLCFRTYQSIAMLLYKYLLMLLFGVFSNSVG